MHIIDARCSDGSEIALTAKLPLRGSPGNEVVNKIINKDKVTLVLEVLSHSRYVVKHKTGAIFR